MEMTSIEKRVQELELRLVRLGSIVQSVSLKADKAGQDAGFASTPQTISNQNIFHCITTGTVTARIGTTMGTGVFNFVVASGSTLTTYAGYGTFTGFTDSSTGWTSSKYCRVTWMDNHWEFITADTC